jgi:hypothetical protein
MSTTSGGLNIVTNGLVLYLDAANSNSYVSGSIRWNDISKTQTSGSLINGPTFNPANGGGITFDGVDDDCNINYSTNSVDMTIETTLKVISLPSTKVFVGKYAGANWWFGASSGNFNFSIDGSQISGGAITLNRTYTVHCVNGSINKSIYVDGNLINSSAKTTNAATGNIHIGQFGDFGGFNSNIIVYNFKLYNRELSAAEIKQNYNTTKTRFGL